MLRQADLCEDKHRGLNVFIYKAADLFIIPFRLKSHQGSPKPVTGPVHLHTPFPPSINRISSSVNAAHVDVVIYTSASDPTSWSNLEKAKRHAQGAPVNTASAHMEDGERPTTHQTGLLEECER